MLNTPATAPIYLYLPIADMRKGFNGLMGLIEQAGLAEKSLSGAWFVFRNRRADRMKILYFDRDGLAFLFKRLEQGSFQWPESINDRDSTNIDPGELRLILDGFDLASVKRRKRYRRPDSGAPGAEETARGRKTPKILWKTLSNWTTAARALRSAFNTDARPKSRQSRGRQPHHRPAVRAA